MLQSPRLCRLYLLHRPWATAVALLCVCFRRVALPTWRYCPRPALPSLPVQALENRTLDSKREMDIMAALDEMKALNAQHAKWVAGPQRERGFRNQRP